MAEQYAADMSWEAKAWARHTGIAAGWLQSTEMPTYQIGCCKCGFAYRRTCSIAQLDELDGYFRTGAAEYKIEEIVHHAFSEKAREFGCIHFQHYLAAENDIIHKKFITQEAFNDWADHYLQTRRH